MRRPVSAARPTGPPTAGRTVELDALLDVMALGVSVGLAIVIALGLSGPVRELLALAFMVFIPGQAIVTNWPATWPPLWPSAQARSVVALPIVLSLSVLVLVALVSLWLHLWYPMALYAGELVASTAALAVALVRRYSGRPDELLRERR